MSVITQQQVLELEANSNFREIAKQFIRDYSVYLTTQDGTPGNTAGFSPIEWAKRRYIAKGIMLHPNSQPYVDWASQFAILLKGQNVWDTNAATTIEAMITSGKFEELAILTFELRAGQIEF